MLKRPRNNKLNRYRSSTAEKAPFPGPALILGLIILALLGYTFVHFAQKLVTDNHTFVLKKVIVEGNDFIDENVIKNMAAVKKGQPIFDVSPDEITERILENPYFKGVSINRSLPSALIISVQERQPVAYLVDKRMYMIDEYGIILLKKPRMSLDNLPLITGLTVPSLLNNRQPLFEALKLIDIIEDVDESLFPYISEIHISNKEPPCIYLIKGGAEVEIGSREVPKRIFLLSEFLKKSEIVKQLENVKKINFTYKNRIVITKKS